MNVKPPASLQVLDEFELPSEPGGERKAIERVSTAVSELDVSRDRRESLETAVGEAVVNAMEHGNAYVADVLVEVGVRAGLGCVQVTVTDQGGGTGFLVTAEEPDIEAKLRGEQSPRGWGLFLIRSLVDRVHETSDGHHHTLTLEMSLGGPRATDRVPR